MNFVTLDILSDLTYGKALELVTKLELRWIVVALFKSSYRDGLKLAFPWLFDVDFNHWYNPSTWSFRDMADEPDRISDVFTKYSNDRLISMEKANERIDIVSTLLAAHDPKTGGQFSDLETWDEVTMMMAAGKSNLKFTQDHSGI